MFKKAKTVFITLYASIAMYGTVHAAADTDGLWMLKEGEKETVFQFQPCRDDANKLCVIFYNFVNRPVPLDIENPDPALKGRSLCGAEFISSLEKKKNSEWQWDNGRVYDIRSGKNYSAAIKLSGPNEITFIGYMGIKLPVGKRIWNRISPDKHPPRCQ